MKIPFTYQILIGMAAGLLFGYFFPGHVSYVIPIGQMFIRLLKMIVIPMMFFSIVDGITRVGSSAKLSSLGLRSIVYYLSTTALATSLGLFLVNFIRPGEGVKVFGSSPAKEVGVFSFFDFIPSNIAQAFVKGDTLQIIFIAILFGVALVRLSEKTLRLVDVIHDANELFLELTGYIIRLAPIGVFCLLAGLTQALDWQTFMGIGKFAMTIIMSLIIHGCVVLPLIFKTFSNRSLWDFVKKMQPALLMSFSTSSSSATLPVTMKCVEEDAKIPKEIAGFVLPVGATVNMDGTAIYEASACLFIAQALGVELTLFQQVIVFFTASLAAIGAAAIPSAGLVTLTVVLNAVGLPLEGIGFLLAIDRPLDMSRTIVNVWGDMVGCAVLEGKIKKNIRSDSQ